MKPTLKKANYGNKMSRNKFGTNAIDCDVLLT